MAILNIILAAVIAALGFPIGLLLAKLAKEEIKPGKKYFIYTQKVLFILAIILVLYSYHLNIFLFLILGIIITLLIIKFEIKADYLVLAFLFILSLKNPNLLIAISALIFLYGFPTAALKRLKKK